MNIAHPARSITFRSTNELYHADTCKPLEAAARRGEVRLAALGHGSYPGQRLPSQDLREVRSVGCWDARGKQSWGLGWHRNEGIEFTYLAAGRLPFAVDKRSTELTAGDMTITRPWQKHRVGNPHVGASRLIWLIVDVGVRRPNQPWCWPKWLLLSPAELQRLTHQLRHTEQIAWSANRQVAHCFTAIAALVKNKPNNGNLTRLKILTNEMLIALADLLNQQPPRLNPRLSSAERAVQLFLAELSQRLDEPWTLETMARQCGLGRSQFSHYCRKLTNRAPADYLTRSRVDAAAEMLRQDPQRSITDAAFACGFQSSQYFATVFRRRMGRSPRNWRISLSE